MPILSENIPVAAPALIGREFDYVKDCLESTWISSSGRYIELFETAFAEFCGVRHVIACNNGTSSLHLALAALGVGPGDEVIIPDLTYIASANAVAYCGARPVFVDNDRRTFNLDPSTIEQAITPRTRGIMAVHLFGHPCDMDPILEIAQRRSLFVIEDAAEAHGARYRGKRVGGFGLCGSFSFFGNKIITTGEGGAITTNDGELATRLRLLRNQGMDPNRRYWHPVIGFNYRMTNVAAAIGVAQLENIDHFLETRKRIASWYNEGFANLDSVSRPFVESWAEHSYWMYTLTLDPDLPLTRDELMHRLQTVGIETRPVFYPLHKMPPYFRTTDRFENAEFCGMYGLNLPTYSGLTRSQVDRVVESVRRSILA